MAMDSHSDIQGKGAYPGISELLDIGSELTLILCHHGPLLEWGNMGPGKKWNANQSLAYEGSKLTSWSLIHSLTI